MSLPGFARTVVDPNDWLESADSDFPHRTFLKTPAGRALSYRDLCAATGRIAQALRQRGVGPGERVAARLEKSVESVLLYIACLRAGAVFVPINIASSLNEVEYFLTDSSPHLAVVDPAEHAELSPLAQRAGIEHLETLSSAGAGSLAELAGGCGPRFEAPPPDPDALAALVYTSGTTGRSKGAMLTRGNLASNAAVLAASWRFSPEDVLLHALPLFHVHGLFVAINTVLASGSALVLLDSFDPAAALRHMAQATVFMGVPTHYTRLLNERALGRDATAHMRLFVSGSAPLLAETQREFLRRTGHEILERYGMTETLMNTSNPYAGARVPGSVGPALPGVSVRVTELDSATPLNEPDRVGMLEVRGPNVFAGYWHDADKTRGAFSAEGWFRTGDLGRIDRDGYVFIVGRAKDLVISGGYNVYPKEVESELDALPGVIESAVFGVPHPDFGEGVTAAVVLEPAAQLTEAEIIAAVRPRLARYKVPKRVLLVAELPRNAMGKVRKEALRSAYAALYRLP